MGAHWMNKRTIAGAIVARARGWRESAFTATSDGAALDPARATTCSRRCPRMPAWFSLSTSTRCRQSPFLAELYKWAPQTKADADYAQFLKSTGFNYETDLNRVSIAVLKRGKKQLLFAIAEGRFDRKKISAYALQTGTRENRGGAEIFSVPLAAGTRRITFTFLRNDRIALTNDANLESLLSRTPADADTQAWRERFRRLAGSPVFAVVRQDAGAGAALRRASARRIAVAPALGSYSTSSNGSPWRENPTLTVCASCSRAKARRTRPRASCPT